MYDVVVEFRVMHHALLKGLASLVTSADDPNAWTLRLEDKGIRHDIPRCDLVNS